MNPFINLWWTAAHHWTEIKANAKRLSARKLKTR
jgi:hypothetical protein